MDIYEYIHLYQYDLLTGELEQEISGTLVVGEEVVTLTPYFDLLLNKEYHVVVLQGLEGVNTGALLQDYESIFTTQMTPMYSSVVLVKMTAGALLDDVKDDTINRSILVWSIYAKALSPLTFSASNVPWYITRWVTCKVAYELLAGTLERYISQSVSKRLGDFEVSATQNPAVFLRPKLNELTSCLDTTTLYILNLGKRHAGAAWTVKAKTALEAATHLIRVPIETGRQFDLDDITSEDYTADNKRKKLWF